MAESFSVKAILSAKDSNFSSTMKACSGYAENLKSTLTSGIGFGAMAAIGSKAVSVVGNGLKSLTTGAISAGTNFESAMSSVASISGATGNDLKELTSKAKQMGATTQFSQQKQRMRWNTWRWLDGKLKRYGFRNRRNHEPGSGFGIGSCKNF